MAYFDDQLALLQQRVEQKKRQESRLKELYAQREALSAKVGTLKKSKLEEEADVDRLEGRSLAAFFYGVIGRMDEKLDKEREEAYAAGVKYDVAARELFAVEEDIRRCEAQLEQLRDCGQQYEKALKDKLAAIKSGSSQAAADIFRAEERVAYLENQAKEIQEALRVGQAALDTANGILSSLNSAQGWGTWDLFGGGLITNIAKHSHLDDAQSRVEQLQVQLRRFKTELTDVTIHADMQVNIDGFLRFADYFFDGLFADWAVLDKIEQSQTQMRNTKVQIEQVTDRLTAMSDTAGKELENEKDRLKDLILRAAL